MSMTSIMRCAKLGLGFQIPTVSNNTVIAVWNRTVCCNVPKKPLDADDDTVQFVSWFIAVRLFPVMAAASGIHRGKPNDWVWIGAGTVMTTERARGERFRVLSLGEKGLRVALETEHPCTILSSRRNKKNKNAGV
jgi:hypothetical protein